MTTPNLLPFWVSTDLQSFGPVSGPIANLANGTSAFAATLATGITTQAAKAVDVNTRLTTWYTAQTQPVVDAVQTLTDQAANFLHDTWDSGINWYILRPSYGGFEAVTAAIAPSINNPSDPNAPRYSDDMYAGAVMLLLTGPPFTLFQAANILILLSTGRTADALTALKTLTTNSSVAGNVVTALSNLASLPEAAWNSETTQLQTLFSASPLAKLLGSDEFPMSLLHAADFSVSGINPSTVKESTSTVFTLSGNGFMPSDVVTLGAVQYPITYIDSQTVTITVPTTAVTLKTPGIKNLTITHKGVNTAAGSITVVAPSLFDELSNLSDPLYFDTWHAITTGSALNTLLPGAATFVDKTLQTLDVAGQAAVDAQSLGQSALQATGARVTSTAAKAAADLTNIGTSASDFLTSLTDLSASVLVIPPCLGGNHELSYALGQGLNGFALNTPVVNPDDGVMAMFFCAGDPNRDIVVAAINTVASVLHISSWPTLV